MATKFFLLDYNKTIKLGTHKRENNFDTFRFFSLLLIFNFVNSF